jgi:hypothetical protein
VVATAASRPSTPASSPPPVPPMPTKSKSEAARTFE